MNKVGEVYSQMADGYDAHDDTVQFLAEDEFIYNQILTPKAWQKTVIDLGCGTGRALQWLWMIAPYNYQGYDVSDGMLEIARRKFGQYTFKKMDMREVPTRPNCLVISLYGSPCYMPIVHLRNLIETWHLAGADIVLLLYGHGRNRGTYTATHEKGLNPVLYGKSYIRVLKKLLPTMDVRVTGVDVYQFNKWIKNVKLYNLMIRIQAVLSRWGLISLDKFAWVLLEIPAAKGA